VNEMFNALLLFEYFTGKAFYKNEKPNKKFSQEQCIEKGKELLQSNATLADTLEIEAEGFENSKRKTVIIKVRQAYELFVKLITYYGTFYLVKVIEQYNGNSMEDLPDALPFEPRRSEWLNVGGQLMQNEAIESLKKKVKDAAINSWNDLHE